MESEELTRCWDAYSIRQSSCKWEEMWLVQKRQMLLMVIKDDKKKHDEETGLDFLFHFNFV